MTKREAMKLFEDRKIRTVWDDEQEKWYFSIVDVVGALVDSKDYQTARKYWNKLKQRLKEEGFEPVTNCYQLKLRAEDGKLRLAMSPTLNNFSASFSLFHPPKQSLSSNGCHT